MGWTETFCAEIESFPCSLLKHYYPTVPNYGDITGFARWPVEPVNLLAGGTPCQSFSIAGLRKGLDDPRGNLTLTYLAIVAKYQPAWIVWENVPGVLSHDGGRTFATFLGGLGQLGYGFAYRVLDAQYVRTCGHPRAVPQRRRRVFVVGYFGDWRRAAAVLFDSESLRGNPPPSRSAGQSVAGTFSARTQGGGGLGTDFELGGGIVNQSVANCLTKSTAGASNTDPDSRTLLVAHALRGEGHDASEDGTGRGTPLVASPVRTRPYADNASHESQLIAFPGRMSGTQCARAENIAPSITGNPTAIAFDTTQITSRANRSNPKAGDPCHPLAAGAHPPALAAPSGVRRLTVAECEFLMGMPRNYTAILINGKPAADGPRYKALGNSMCVNVMSWIGQRIEMATKL